MTKKEENPPKENKIVEENKYQLLVKDIEIEFGEGAANLLGKNDIQERETISTGSFLLDKAILPGEKKGGYVKGKIIEIYGLQSVGKSTLALHAVKECQISGGKAAYFDLEKGVDLIYAKNIGVKTENLLMLYPSSGEMAFDMMGVLIKKDIDMIIVDSVSNLVPLSYIEASLEKLRVGSHAALMSSGLRRLKTALTKKKTIIIFINQMRKNISTTYFIGNPEMTTGGMALNFDADVRIQLRQQGKIEKADKIIGIKVTAKIVKNKLSRPEEKAEIEIIYSYGIQRTREIFKLAVEQNIIAKNGNWYSYKDKKIGNGSEAAIDYLNNNLEDYQEITQKIFVV